MAPLNAALTYSSPAIAPARHAREQLFQHQFCKTNSLSSNELGPRTSVVGARKTQVIKAVLQDIQIPETKNVTGLRGKLNKVVLA